MSAFLPNPASRKNLSRLKLDPTWVGALDLTRSTLKLLGNGAEKVEAAVAKLHAERLLREQRMQRAA